jgi:hypothetical protein
MSYFYVNAIIIQTPRFIIIRYTMPWTPFVMFNCKNFNLKLGKINFNYLPEFMHRPLYDFFYILIEKIYIIVLPIPYSSQISLLPELK